MDGTCHSGGTEGGQEKTGSIGGRGRGKTTERVSLTPQQIMEADEVVVQSGDGTGPAVRSNHNQEDHSGACGTLPRHPPPPLCR